MQTLTAEQQTLLDLAAARLARRNPMATHRYDVLAWSQALLAKFEASKDRPAWYAAGTNADPTMRYYLTAALLKGGIAQTEAAARLRLQANPRLAAYTNLLLDRWLLLEYQYHLQWLLTAEPCAIAQAALDIVEPGVPRADQPCFEETA